MAMSGLSSTKALVSTGRAISLFLGMNGPRKEPPNLVRPSFSSIHGPFFSYARLASSESLD